MHRTISWVLICFHSSLTSLIIWRKQCPKSEGDFNVSTWLRVLSFPARSFHFNFPFKVFRTSYSKNKRVCSVHAQSFSAGSVRFIPLSGRKKRHSGKMWKRIWSATSRRSTQSQFRPFCSLKTSLCFINRRLAIHYLDFYVFFFEFRLQFSRCSRRCSGFMVNVSCKWNQIKLSFVQVSCEFVGILDLESLCWLRPSLFIYKKASILILNQ